MTTTSEMTATPFTSVPSKSTVITSTVTASHKSQALEQPQVTMTRMTSEQVEKAKKSVRCSPWKLGSEAGPP